MISGFICINKPAGITSFKAVRTAAKALGSKKAGHAGTLDPFATGVLPVAIGEATKAVRYLHLTEKTYVATIRFGILTDTLDITGREIASSAIPTLTGDAIDEALKQMQGEILQKPPSFSAIRINGRRLYDLARNGEPAEAPMRKVVIHETALIDIRGNEASVRVRCGTGTYIRSLARDIGALLGTHAILSALCRTSYGPFELSSSVAPENADQGHMFSITEALPHLKMLAMQPEACGKIRNGMKIDRAFLNTGGADVPDEKRFAVTEPGGEFAAVIHRNDDDTFEIERVFNRPHNP